MTAPNDEVSRIRDQLERCGAGLVEDTRDGAFGPVTYATDDVVLQLVGEYGQWRAVMGLADGPLFPVSFWLAALDGEQFYPDPPVTDEDLLRLEHRCRALLARAPELAPRVVAMGEAYRRAMRERLE